MQHVAHVADPAARVRDPPASPQDRVDLRDQGVGVGGVVGPGPAVHEVAPGIPQVGPAVLDDGHGDAAGHRRVRPPPAQTDADDAGDGSGRGHPVGLLHVRVGVEDAVVQGLGQRHLASRDDDRPDEGVGHDRDHHPARPDGVPEQLEGADRWVLRLDQPGDGVPQQHRADQQQRHRGGEVAAGDGAVASVGILGRGALADLLPSDQEGDGRHEREQVLDPGGLHRLGRTHDEVDGCHAGHHVGDGDPLEAGRAVQGVALLLRQRRPAEPRRRRAAHDAPPAELSSQRSRSDRRAFSPAGTARTCCRVWPPGSVDSA